MPKKSKLQKQLKKMRALLKAARRPQPEVVGPTIAEWLPTFKRIVAERGYKPQTIKNRGAAQKHIQALWGVRPLRALKPFEIASRLKSLSPHTAGRVLFELRDLYNEAIANDEADTNPAAHVKAPPSPGLRKRLTLETWKAMLLRSKASRQRWVYPMLLLAMATGQRRGDLAKMRFSDVVDGHLRVEQLKKARKKIGARLAIPLSLRLDATGMTLGEVIETCREAGPPGETLLRTRSGGPIEPSSLSARFSEHLRAEIDEAAYKRYERPSLHEVRSLSARTYIAEGMAPATVQTLLGHKHEEMTQVYLDDRGLTEAEWKTVDPMPA